MTAAVVCISTARIRACVATPKRQTKFEVHGCRHRLVRESQVQAGNSLDCGPTQAECFYFIGTSITRNSAISVHFRRCFRGSAKASRLYRSCVHLRTGSSKYGQPGKLLTNSPEIDIFRKSPLNWIHKRRSKQEPRPRPLSIDLANRYDQIDA